MMLRALFVAAALTCGTGAALADDLPDPTLTPGVAASTNVSAVCKRAAAKSMRSVAPDLEREVYDRYGLRDSRAGYCASARGCAVDHLIPVELGGSDDLENLWPQRLDSVWGAQEKARLAERLRKLVCSGQLGIQRAQLDISTDWIAAYRDYLGQ